MRLAVSPQVDDLGVHVTWESGHTSLYPLDWLAKRSFRPEARAGYRLHVGGGGEGSRGGVWLGHFMLMSCRLYIFLWLQSKCVYVFNTVHWQVSTPQTLWGCELMEEVPTAQYSQVREGRGAGGQGNRGYVM